MKTIEVLGIVQTSPNQLKTRPVFIRLDYFRISKRRRRKFLEVALTKRRNPSKIRVSEVFSMRKLRLRRKQTNKIPSEPYLPKNPGNRTLSPKNPPTPHPPTLYPVILSYISPNPVNILVKPSVTDHFDSVSPMARTVLESSQNVIALQ